MSQGLGELVPQLIEVGGAHPGRVHTIPYGVHIIGRGREADVQINDKDVSRRHAKIEVGPEGVIFYDLGSKNGVVTRGQRLVRPTALAHGETIDIGELTLKVSHPASQVAKLLQSAGETTITSTHTHEAPRQEPAGLALPLLGVIVFGVLAVVLLLL